MTSSAGGTRCDTLSIVSSPVAIARWSSPATSATTSSTIEAYVRTVSAVTLL
jgi:hypothetical protein